MAKGVPFRLNHMMSCNWFDYIFSDICFNNREVPYKDGFFHTRQLGESWNQNMAQHIFSSWINVLDESMIEWLTSGLLDLCVSSVRRITLVLAEYHLLRFHIHSVESTYRGGQGQANSTQSEEIGRAG